MKEVISIIFRISRLLIKDETIFSLALLWAAMRNIHRSTEMDIEHFKYGKLNLSRHPANSLYAKEFSVILVEI